jgi:hypothetical protein
MSKAKVSLGVSDDYASLRTGDLRFYYGYEELMPENPTEEEIEAEKIEWAFVVKRGRETLVRWSRTEVVKRTEKGSRDDLWGTDTILLAGIGAWLKEQQEVNDE